MKKSKSMHFVFFLLTCTRDQLGRIVCGETEHRTGVKIHRMQNKYGRLLNFIAVLAYLLEFVNFG